MDKRLIEIRLLATCVACLIAADALGQVQARINRTSDQSASSQLGRIGGNYTGRYGDADNLTNVSRSDLGVGSSGITQPNFLGAAWKIGQLPEPALPQAFLYTAPSVRAPVTQSPWARYLGGIDEDNIAYYSGLTSSTNLTRPLSASMPRGFPVSESRYVVPDRTNSGYAAFFNLQAPPETANPMELRGLTWVELLERDNAALLVQKKDRALKLFKEGTHRATEDRDERLAEAQEAMLLIRDMESESPLPCLLLMHIALEKQQVQSALNELAEAVDRDPRVFLKYTDLSVYYGDPDLLAETMRLYFDLGDNVASESAAAMQAYFALMLNDEIRLRSALNRMTELEAEEASNPRLRAVRAALSAAATQQQASGAGNTPRP